MNFTFLCLVIQCVFICIAHAKYNKDVVCVIDQDNVYDCKIISRSYRRQNENKVNTLPSHDPYIPRTNEVLYNCTSVKCEPLNLRSLTDLTSLDTTLKTCYKEPKSDNYNCDTIKYQNLKNIDKLLFLTNNIRNKTFYIVDCLVYVDGGRVCHMKDKDDSPTNLIDTGTIARPNEPSVLSQEEFICEEGEDKFVNCDTNSYIPYDNGLKLKENIKINGEVLLKRGSYVVILRHNCIKPWCGYSGRIVTTRRYDPPGGKVYRCYYAKKQQVCKELYSSYRNNNIKNWLNTK